MDSGGAGVKTNAGKKNRTRGAGRETINLKGSVEVGQGYFVNLENYPGFNGFQRTSLSDSSNWWANAGTATLMFLEWDLGVGPSNRTFNNDRIAGAMRNAWKVNEAREFFYNKYAGVSDLSGASVTNYKGSFGLEGALRAGIDPIEQFVGSYRIDIYATEGNMLQFKLSNSTSMKSFLYGRGPSWERSSFRFSGNTTQNYIFTEPIR